MRTPKEKKALIEKIERMSVLSDLLHGYVYGAQALQVSDMRIHEIVNTLDELRQSI